MEAIAEYLLAAQDGDPRAFEQVVRLTRRDLVRYCRAMGDADTVDDLVQDTYLRALRSLHGFRNEAPGLAWLLTIARRVCADAVARRRRDRQFRLPRRRETTPTDHVDLSLLLRHLDADQREAFVLTQVLGYSYDDAAIFSGCPIGTIRSRVARARARLADLVAAARTA